MVRAFAGDSTMTSDVDIGGQLKGTDERLSNTWGAGLTYPYRGSARVAGVATAGRTWLCVALRNSAGRTWRRFASRPTDVGTGCSGRQQQGVALPTTTT